MSYPFKHIVVDSFLTPQDLEKARHIHGKQEFFLKYTDLFKFLQTEEIAQRPDLKFFIQLLEKLFEGITNTKECFYTIFGSYYREGDFLLCHDDRVDNRKYAFTYYLDDFESGSLILYNADCDKEVKSIPVKSNRLIIFEVSSISWHEVGFCRSNGRRAFTGWLNHREIEHQFDQAKLLIDYDLPQNIEYVDFDLKFDDSPIIQYPDMEYDFEYSVKKETGPFFMRRVNEIHLDTYIALSIIDHKLIYIKAYELEDLNYILLNDSTNNIEGELLDIFILECDSVFEECIKFLGKDGKHQFSLTMLPKVMYAIKREDRSYFIENGVQKQFKLVHMIYKLI